MAKKHYSKKKIFGQKILEITQNAPMSERLVTAKGTITFRDKSKWHKATERRKNKIYSY